MILCIFRDGWARGALKAENQNFARKIEETPGILMTPSLFAQVKIIHKFQPTIENLLHYLYFTCFTSNVFWILVSK